MTTKKGAFIFFILVAYAQQVAANEIEVNAAIKNHPGANSHHAPVKAGVHDLIPLNDFKHLDTLFKLDKATMYHPNEFSKRPFEIAVDELIQKNDYQLMFLMLRQDFNPFYKNTATQQDAIHYFVEQIKKHKTRQQRKEIYKKLDSTQGLAKKFSQYARRRARHINREGQQAEPTVEELYYAVQNNQISHVNYLIKHHPELLEKTDFLSNELPIESAIRHFINTKDISMLVIFGKYEQGFRAVNPFTGSDAIYYLAHYLSQLGIEERKQFLAQLNTKPETELLAKLVEDRLEYRGPSGEIQLKAGDISGNVRRASVIKLAFFLLGCIFLLIALLRAIKKMKVLIEKLTQSLYNSIKNPNVATPISNENKQGKKNKKRLPLPDSWTPKEALSGKPSTPSSTAKVSSKINPSTLSDEKYFAYVLHEIIPEIYNSVQENPRIVESVRGRNQLIAILGRCGEGYHEDRIGKYKKELPEKLQEFLEGCDKIWRERNKETIPNLDITHLVNLAKNLNNSNFRLADCKFDSREDSAKTSLPAAASHTNAAPSETISLAPTISPLSSHP